jgi:flagellar biosynthesis protein FlhF
VIVLVGPPGAGKTTNLVKLAVSYGLAQGKSVHFISVDNYRIGGADQLRTFAGILGAGFQALETVRGLDTAIEEARSKDLIFVDTPGFSRATWEEAAELESWLRSHPQVDTHLVVPASMNAADLRQVVDRFRALQPGKLLFTRLDETEAWGTVVSESLRTALPLAFLSTGQSIPEDIEAASPKRMIQASLARFAPVAAESMAA